MIPKVAKESQKVAVERARDGRARAAETETDRSTALSDVNILGINNGEQMANDRERRCGDRGQGLKNRKREIMAENGLVRNEENDKLSLVKQNEDVKFSFKKYQNLKKTNNKKKSLH